MKEQIEKIKEHIYDHRVAYIAGISGLLAGGFAVYIYSRTGEKPQIINNVSPVFNNTNAVQFSGYTHKIVKCNETGELWATVKEAALSAGVEISKMSRHLNGHMEHINGSTYSIIGVGTDG